MANENGNGNVDKWLARIAAALMVPAVCGGFITVLEVRANTVKIEELEDDDAKHADEIDRLDDAVREVPLVKKDVDYIRESVDDLNQKFDRFLEAQDES